MDPNSKGECNRTCLHHAAKSNNLELFKYLVSKGANINARDNDSDLPLHFACWKGHLEIIKYFITDLNIDPNSRGWNNRTCLHNASESGNLEMVKYLVSKGVDIYARDDFSNLPMHYACEYEHLKIIKYFITDLNMDPNSKGECYRTCLHIAAKSNNLGIVKFLIENGGKDSLNAKDNWNKTPLQVTNKKEILDYLKYLE